MLQPGCGYLHDRGGDPAPILSNCVTTAPVGEIRSQSWPFLSQTNIPGRKAKRGLFRATGSRNFSQFVETEHHYYALKWGWSFATHLQLASCETVSCNNLVSRRPGRKSLYRNSGGWTRPPLRIIHRPAISFFPWSETGCPSFDLGTRARVPHSSRFCLGGIV